MFPESIDISMLIVKVGGQFTNYSVFLSFLIEVWADATQVTDQ